MVSAQRSSAGDVTYNEGETLGTGQTPNHPGSLKGSNVPLAAFRCSSLSGSGASGGACVTPGDPRRAVMLLAFGEPVFPVPGDEEMSPRFARSRKL